MPICFICCGILLIFMLFGVFNSNFCSKLNFSLMLLYLVTQIFSFFIKDANISQISIVYIVPIAFSVLLFAVNITKINIIKMLTISVLIATLLIAIGFVDNAFLDFIENHIFEVCLIVSTIALIFSKTVNESFVTIVVGFALFVFGIIFKQNVTLDLTTVVVLNCLTLSITLNFFAFGLKILLLNVLRRWNNAKVKKI